MAAFVLPFMEFGLVRLFFVVALARQQRAEGGGSTSRRQLDPTDVDTHDYPNSMHKCSNASGRPPVIPTVATAGHANAALRQFATVGRT